MKKQPSLTARHLLAASFLTTCALLPVHAAPVSDRNPASRSDVLGNFRILAQQRPWACRAPGGGRSRAAAEDAEAVCAWQNRLRTQSWRWSEGGASSCLSSQARWWNQAQAALPAGAARSVWDRRWNAQSMHFESGGEHRLLLLERAGDGQWQATEWRWNPHPRAATRRWQQGRWNVLLEAAAGRRTETAVSSQRDVAKLQPVLRRVLGARPGELGPGGLRLETAGRCLQVGNPLPGQSRLPLSYSPNDSRLEQRAAMHLQLSRLHPDAKWLTPFKMLDMPGNVPSGAKFLATWVDRGTLNSQLWMPGKNDAATVRLRASTALPRGQEDAAVVWQARQALERELAAIALYWATAYE